MVVVGEHREHLLAHAKVGSPLGLLLGDLGQREADLAQAVSTDHRLWTAPAPDRVGRLAAAAAGFAGVAGAFACARAGFAVARAGFVLVLTCFFFAVCRHRRPFARAAAIASSTGTMRLAGASS